MAVGHIRQYGSTVLKFEGSDPHDLLNILMEANRVTSAEGKKPFIEIGGKNLQLEATVSSMLKSVPSDEPMRPHHNERIKEFIQKRHPFYGRAAWNLCQRAHQIVLDSERHYRKRNANRVR
jgi:hypothetical protein